MRPFSSAGVAATILAGAIAIAVVLLRSPLGDPVAARLAQSDPEESRVAADPPAPAGVESGPSMPSVAVPAPSPSASVARRREDLSRYSDNRAAVARQAEHMLAAPPGTAAGPAGRAAGEPSASRIMFCHLDERGRSASEVLQECLDRAPALSSVEIPPGEYVLDRQVVISRPVTLRTAGTAGTSVSCAAVPAACATLRASPELNDSFGMLLAWNTANVTLEDLVIDGNRAARLASAAARWCQLGRTASGFNAGALGCTNCALQNVVSRNALCGTAMVWSGPGAVIRESEFRDNGDASTPKMWADGLTLLYAPQSDIRQNRFIDNSDIGLIVGHAAQSRIEGNVIMQRRQRVFAGLMLDNFNSNDLARRGDFRGAIIARNTIDCASQLCVFGIQIGPRPWYPTQNIVGGELTGNAVTGAHVGINIDGAGARLAPLIVADNRIDAVAARARFADCGRPIPTAALNVSPTSIVRLARPDVADAAHLSDPCQLWSAVVPLHP